MADESVEKLNLTIRVDAVCDTIPALWRDRARDHRDHQTGANRPDRS